MGLNLKGKIEIVGRTDEGQVRDHNEDYIGDNVTLGLAVLADGMGGLNAGEVASSMTVHHLMEELIAYRLGDPEASEELAESEEELPEEARVVRKAVESANALIFETSQTQPECRGMGTTVVASMFYNNKVAIAHIGDSRVYRFRGGAMMQITKDHSFVQELIDKGLYTKEEARESEKKNVVTRALGVGPFVEVECHEYPTEAGDIYLMCSDGLHDMVSDVDIERAFIEMGSSLVELAAYLVQLANAKGGKDNISVILTRVNKAYPDVESSGLIQKIANWFE